MHFDEHDHNHPHEHHHEHHHEHIHEGNAEMREELVALMKYMVGHNDAHTKELRELAERVHDIGKHQSYDQIMMAAAEFEKGNALLNEALKEI